MQVKRIDYTISRAAQVAGRPERPPDEKLLVWGRVLDELLEDLKHGKEAGLTDADYSRLSRRAKKLTKAIDEYCQARGLKSFEYLPGGAD